MVTRIDWLPYDMNERLTVTRQVAAVIDTYSAVLGLTAAQVTRLKAIPVEIEFAINFARDAQAASKAATSWRDGVLSSKRSNQLAAGLPNFPNTPPPAGTRNGVIAEFRTLVAQIKASPGFTPVIGAAMSILSPNHVKTPLKELKPVPKVQAVDGFRVRIACEMKGMDALQVEYRRNGDDKWQKVAFLTKLPDTFYIEPAVRGVPESGYLRCFFLKKNKIVGQPSNMPPVTIFGS